MLDKPVPDLKPPSWSSPRRGVQPSRRSLHDGDLRRQRRSDKTPGDAGALQPFAHQGAAGEIRFDRRGPCASGTARELARPPSRHAEKLRRQCRRRVRRRRDRRDGVEAAGGEDDLRPGRLDEPELYEKLRGALAEAEKTQGTQGNVIFYLAVADRFFGTVVEQLGKAKLTDAEQGRERQASVLAPRGDREAVRP